MSNDKAKLIVRVKDRTLINLRRHSLEKTGAGKVVPIGSIIDDLVESGIPDYAARDTASTAPPINKDELPKIVHES